MVPARAWWILCAGWIGCSGGGQSAPDVAGDASSEASTDPPPADTCCQITKNVSTDPALQDCLYGCYPDAASSTEVAWLCNVAHPTTCDDPSCVVGSTCQGFNGTGTVVACDGTALLGRIRLVESLCP